MMKVIEIYPKVSRAKCLYSWLLAIYCF